MYKKEDVLQAIDKYVAVNNRLPKTSDCKKKNNLPSVQTISQYFGKLSSLLKHRYPALYEKERVLKREEHIKAYKERRGIKDDEYKKELLERIDAFVRIHERLPKRNEFTVTNGLASIHTMTKYLGNIKDLFNKRYPQYITERKWNEEKVKLAVDEFIKTNGRYPLTIDFCSKNNLPSRMVIGHYIGSVQKKLAEWYPDYVPKVYKWDKQNIAEAVGRFVKDNRRLPTCYELNSIHGLPNCSTIKVHHGGLKKFFSEFFPEYEIHKKGQHRDKTVKKLDDFDEDEHEGMSMKI